MAVSQGQLRAERTDVHKPIHRSIFVSLLSPCPPIAEDRALSITVSVISAVTYVKCPSRIFARRPSGLHA